MRFCWRPKDRPNSEADCDIGRYGSTATEHIINALMKTDSDPGHYRAQIFGGGAVIKTNNPGSDIGRKNIEVAQKMLTAHRIRIIREEAGGTRGKRVRFDTATNTVFCRFAGQIAKKRREL